MKFPIFASFVIFVIWLTLQLHRVKKRDAKHEHNFWDIENKANSTRRKSLADLRYIVIPDELPWHTLENLIQPQSSDAQMPGTVSSRSADASSSAQATDQSTHNADQPAQVASQSAHVAAQSTHAAAQSAHAAAQSTRAAAQSTRADAQSAQAAAQSAHAAALLDTLTSLRSRQIVNFSGLSNTQLKLEYGAPNIQLLTEYDTNFMELVTALEDWAELLLFPGVVTARMSISAGADDSAILEARSLLDFAKPVEAPTPPTPENTQAAKQILEYAVSIQTDIVKSYELLIDLYRTDNHPEKIEALRSMADTLPERTRVRVLRRLS